MRTQDLDSQADRIELIRSAFLRAASRRSRASPDRVIMVNWKMAAPKTFSPGFYQV